MVVEMKPHDPAWASAAALEIDRLKALLGDVLVEVHHIGSTSIPGAMAKPILDLLAVLKDLGPFDAKRSQLEDLGYEWWGEYGLAGRRYCTLDDRVTGKRRVHLHCYEEGDPGITRHLAFRDYLKVRPDLLAEYEAVKRNCAEAHRQDSHAYSTCKGDWVRRIEAEALARLA